MIKLELTVFR